MMTTAEALVGRWRIAETVAWPREHLALCGPAFLRIDPDGTGKMAFGALTAMVNTGFIASGIDLDWNGSDQGGPVQYTGWADLRDDGRLDKVIAYDNGDETTFSAERWPFLTAY